MMDERVAARRKGVSEDRARKRLRRVLILLAVVLLAVGGLWLIRSPVLSISTVEVNGESVSNPEAYVSGLSMGVGTPTIDVRAGAIAEAIEADPWIATADVTVVWPGTLVVDVVEHEPLAPVKRGDEWYTLSAAGAVLELAQSPDATASRVEIDLGFTEVGETSTDPMVLGALSFLESLPAHLRPGTVLFVEGDGLFATVADHRVRLGRPDDLYAKATVLVEMLQQPLEPGAVIDVIAPSRPAVANPQPEVEAEE